MRTARSSSRRGGWGGGLVLIPLNFPLGCWPGPDPPEFPPWVWARIWSSSISPLGVGLDLIPLNFPPGCGPGSDAPEFPPWVWAWIWSPWISPLGVGLDLIPLNFPLGCGPGLDPPSISPLGVGLEGGLLGRGGSPWRGGVPSMHWGRPPPWTEWQTGAKILPCPKLRLRAVIIWSWQFR